jgi:cell division protein FtsX
VGPGPPPYASGRKSRKKRTITPTLRSAGEGMRGFVRSLFGQVVIAVIVGILLGWQYPGVAVALKPLGGGFIKLIKTVLAPIVFGAVVHRMIGAAEELLGETVEMDPTFEPTAAI